MQMYTNSIEYIYICEKIIKTVLIMKQLREELVKKIIEAKSNSEVKIAVLESISELRVHWVCEFAIAIFINKLINELKDKHEITNEDLFFRIRNLHPAGFQWDL
jgi:hypothetical protein